MPPALPNDLISENQAAQLIGVSRDTLLRWVKAGDFRAWTHPITKRRQYRKADVEAFLAAQEGSVSGQPWADEKPRRRRRARARA